METNARDKSFTQMGENGLGQNYGQTGWDRTQGYGTYGQDRGYQQPMGQGLGHTGYQQPTDQGYMGQTGYGTQGYMGQGYMGQTGYGSPRGMGTDQTFGQGGMGRGDFGMERGRTQGQRTRWQREPLMARDIMTPNIKTVTRQSTLREVAQIMKDENVGIVPVVDEQRRLIGVVTDRDLVVRALAEGKSPTDLKVDNVMSDDVEAVMPDEPIHDVIDLMGQKQIRRVPVVDRDDRLLGIISMGDIANRADYDEELQDALERISSKRSFWNRLFG